MSVNQSTLYDAWIERLRAGDESARSEMLNHAADRLRRLARKMLRDYPAVSRWEETDDVVQNASLRLWRALEQVTPESARHFFNFAALEIRRELIELARSYSGPLGDGANLASVGQRDSSGSSRQPLDGAQSTYEPVRLAAWSEFHEQVGKLPDDEREVFDLLWYQELTQTEAAALLGVSERTVKRRWQSARLRIHELLGGQLPGA
jgi:RNA polymerase sigma-70 factor (ECF subfamily)